MKSRLTGPGPLGAAILLAALTSAPTAGAADATAVTTTIECPSASGDTALTGHLRARNLLDAHVLAQTFMALCPASPLRFRWKILDALVLDELDEPARAQLSLWEVVTEAPPAERRVAATLLARSHLIAGDEGAVADSLRRVPPEAAARLRLFAARSEPAEFRRRLKDLGDPDLAREALESGLAYQRALRTRRPWLAGSLSAVLPGAGQAYAGSWQGAAVAFVLNAVLIGATVELAHRQLYLVAGATGLAASVFYLGNVLNAVDLAQRGNEAAALPHRDALERLLLPEAFP